MRVDELIGSLMKKLMRVDELIEETYDLLSKWYKELALKVKVSMKWNDSKKKKKRLFKINRVWLSG